jgi:MFS superfamily sulfate permease-like transporter
MILRMGRVPAIDATGLRRLADLVHQLRPEGTLVILSELYAQPRRSWTTSGRKTLRRRSMWHWRSRRSTWKRCG